MENIEFITNKYGVVCRDLPRRIKEFKVKYFKKEVIIRNTKRFVLSSPNIKRKYAFDTETYQGFCKVLSVSNPTGSKKKSTIFPTFENALRFLCYNVGQKKAYRVFYNLDFDVASILKLWDNIEGIKQLYDGYKVKFGKYTLSYIKGIIFTIRYGRNRVDITDLHKIFQDERDSRLESVLQKYLGKGKLKEKNGVKIDGNLLNTSLKYWKDNLPIIIDYCELDCQRTAQLLELVIETAKNHKIETPKFLCSTASFSKQHFMKNCQIPNITCIPEDIINIACNTFYGGRFECLKLGSTEYLEIWDINSAYSDTTRIIPSFQHGSWHTTKKISKKEIIGFYYVKAEISEFCKLPSLPVKRNGILTFPIGLIEGWFTWYDLDLMRKQKCNTIEVINGVEYIPNAYEKYPFRKMIDKLYAQKYKIKAKRNKFNESSKEYKIFDLAYSLTKKTMNALYGSFIETNKNPEGVIYAGKLFNPINATIITARCRWELIRHIKEEDLPYLWDFHTDSVAFSKPVNIFPKGSALGLWDIEKDKGKSVVMGCGQYQVGKKNATRSFSKRIIGDWFNLIEKNKNNEKIIYRKRRMYKLGQAMNRNIPNMNPVNKMFEETKEIQLNTDIKRNWKKKYETFGQLLEFQNTSKPLYCVKNPEMGTLIF